MLPLEKSLSGAKKSIVSSTGPKTLKELEGKIASAKRDSQLVLAQADVDLIVSRAKQASKRGQYELEVNRLKQVQDNLKKCSIFAPHDGVVAAVGRMPLNKGSQVRPRQVVLILIPRLHLFGALLAAATMGGALFTHATRIGWSGNAAAEMWPLALVTFAAAVLVAVIRFQRR